MNRQRQARLRVAAQAVVARLVGRVWEVTEEDVRVLEEYEHMKREESSRRNRQRERLKVTGSDRGRHAV